MKGKRKIAMKKRETKVQRAVSFSKRRSGLFNKAAELCMLSGAQIAMVVSSPCSKESMYSFGNPSVDAVFDAFVNNRVPKPEDNQINQSAISLSNDIKALEQETKSRDKIDGFFRDFENLEKDFESIDDFLVAEEKLKKLKENALLRLNNCLPSKFVASGSTSNFGYEAGPGNLNQGVSVELINNNGSGSQVENGICTVSGSNHVHLGENYLSSENSFQDGGLGAITKSFSNPEGYFNFNGIGKFGNNQVHNSSVSNGILTALASDYVHPGENIMHDDGDLRAITKSISSPYFTGNLGNSSSYNSNVYIGSNTASVSNAVYPDMNYVSGENDIWEPELGAITNSVANPGAYFNQHDIGLEYNAKQDDFGNLLSMFAECDNQEAPLYPSANTNGISSADCAPQNVFANFANEAMPIATMNQFGQLLSYDIPYFF